MAIEDFDTRMAALNDAWKSAPTEGGFFNELPEPGNYQAVLRAVDFFEQKNPPNCAFLKLVYEVVFDAQYGGREVEMVYNLEPQKLNPNQAEVEMKLGFLKRDLKTLGVPVESDDFSLVQVRPGGAIWDPVLDVPVEIAIKDSKKTNPNTGRPYRNAFLNARVGDPLPKGERLTVQTLGAQQSRSDIPADPPPLPSAADENFPF